MAKRILHILNGDSTFINFQQSGIEGDVAIWREIMAEGPVQYDIELDNSDFWERREEYIQRNYSDEKNYSDLVLKEFQKIERARDYDEVVLWFEYDLFCHINFIACLQLFEHKRVSLICEGYDSNNVLRGLGEIPHNLYLDRFENRQELAPDEIKYLDEVWFAYSNSDSTFIESFLNPHPSFPYLHEVLLAHLKRLPNKNGINKLEAQLLRVIDHKSLSPIQVVRNMLLWQKWYGFGDSQYFRILDSLSILVDNSDDTMSLSAFGKSVLLGDEIFKQPEESIGGVWRQDYFQELFTG